MSKVRTLKYFVVEEKTRKVVSHGLPSREDCLDAIVTLRARYPRTEASLAVRLLTKTTRVGARF